MASHLPVPWPVLVTAVGGAGTTALAVYLYRHWGKPGVAWFVAALLTQSVWAALTVVAWSVFAPGPRRLLEVAIWFPISWIGFLFLGFALAYTGRGDVIRSWLFVLLGAIPAGTCVLMVTNGSHGLFWSGFRVVRVAGVAAAGYEFGVVAETAVAANVVFAAVGVLMLVESIWNYGPLYRPEATAVSLSAVPILVGTGMWAGDVGPLAPLNPVTLGFVPHVLLDGYAFVGTNMFESDPVTLRVAERTAIDDIDAPVFVLDGEGDIVETNPAARTLPGIDGAVGEGFEPALDLDRPVTETGSLTHRQDGERREFRLSDSALTDPTGSLVGRLVVLQDITREKRREQRLQVLNRVLRHNLRNGMSVIVGTADHISETAADETASLADRIVDRGEQLVGMGEKAREFETAMAGDADRLPVELDRLCSSVADEALADHDGTVTVAETDATLRTDPDLLRLACRNLVENGLEHGGDEPHVGVQVEATADAVTVTVSDDGPGIPDEELATLRSGDERPLQHGQGIGLWVVEWCVASLGGETTFDTGPDGTTVRLRLPRPDEG